MALIRAGDGCRLDGGGHGGIGSWIMDFVRTSLMELSHVYCFQTHMAMDRKQLDPEKEILKVRLPGKAQLPCPTECQGSLV